MSKVRIRQIGSNQTEVSLASGDVVLVSYDTPVAALLRGGGFVRTERHYSRATSGHINKWTGGAEAVLVPQRAIEGLLEGLGATQKEQA